MLPKPLARKVRLGCSRARIDHFLPMLLSETDTHAKLVNPRVYQRECAEDRIKREQTTGPVDIIEGKARAERV